jgi:uncharacterized protein DUF5675
MKMSRRLFVQTMFGGTVVSRMPSVKGLWTAHSPDFTVAIYRQYASEKCMSGYLAVSRDGAKEQIICYTLERPWKDNQQNLSSVPAGTYDAHLRYDHQDHWRIELEGVPNRTNVQIHIGNEPDESKGCVLVGTSLTKDLCRISGGTSAQAYAKLKESFYGTAQPKSTPLLFISVSVSDAGKVEGR